MTRASPKSLFSVTTVTPKLHLISGHTAGCAVSSRQPCFKQPWGNPDLRCSSHISRGHFSVPVALAAHCTSSACAASQGFTCESWRCVKLCSLLQGGWWWTSYKGSGWKTCCKSWALWGPPLSLNTVSHTTLGTLTTTDRQLFTLFSFSIAVLWETKYCLKCHFHLTECMASSPSGAHLFPHLLLYHTRLCSKLDHSTGTTDREQKNTQQNISPQFH